MCAIVWPAARQAVPGDFSSFYCGGEILRTRGPGYLYDYAAAKECTQRHFPNASALLPFIRPPFFALAIAPLTVLTGPTAIVVWVLLNAAALAAAVALLARPLGLSLAGVVWLAAIYFPALASFFNRQDLPLLLLVAVTSYRLAASGRHFAAGLTLALCSVKFHLLLLVPIPWVVGRNRPAMKGFATGAALLTGLSLLLVGPSGLLNYGRMLVNRDVPNIQPHPERFANLSNLVGGGWLGIALIVAPVGLVIAASRRRPLLEAQAAAWLGSLIVAPHVTISDYLLAWPSLLLLAPVARVCSLAALPLLFPVIPALLLVNERLVTAAPLAALVCLIGAAAAPAPKTPSP